ncbi:MAG: hypothetical protein HQ541_06855 [Mariniphaga sp.]|nr:hypothetical protein [Mariniphaga sp.]
MKTNFKTFEFSEAIKANAVKDDIFELLCPRREYDWIPHWECEILHSVSGYNEKGCVFTTKNLTSEVPWVWLTQEFDKEKGIVRFAIFAAGLFVMDYTIKVIDTGSSSSELEFNQIFRSISSEGDKVVGSFTYDVLSKHIKPLESMLNEYLAKLQ